MHRNEGLLAGGFKTVKRLLAGFGLLVVAIIAVGRFVPDNPAYEDAADKAHSLVVEIEYIDKTIQMERLLNAIALVESEGNPAAVGDAGGSVGRYQLSEVYVEDVERIIGGDIRRSPTISRAYVQVYLNHYATRERLGAEPTLEHMARIHNGGPDGWMDGATEPYWFKVKERLDAWKE